MVRAPPSPGQRAAAWFLLLLVSIGLVAGVSTVAFEVSNFERLAGRTFWHALEYRYLPVMRLLGQVAGAVLAVALVGEWLGWRLARPRLGPALGAVALAVAIYLGLCRGLTTDLHDLLFGRPAWAFRAGAAGVTLACAGLGLVGGGLAYGLVRRLPGWWRARTGRVVSWVCALVPLLLLALGWVGPQLRPRPQQGRNLLFISMDTLRADHLGCYGYPLPTSPTLDRLAQQGVLFDNAVTQAPWTLPAHMSLFTGLDPASHGQTEFSLSRKNWRRLGDSVPLLAELLARQGYVTAAFTGGGFVSPAFGFARGFDRYGNQGRRLEASIGSVRRFLRRHRDGPFFLFLHFYDCHRPYESPAPFNTRFVPPGTDGGGHASKRFCQEAEAERTVPPSEKIAQVVAQYDGAISHADAQLDALFADLDALELSERTLVVFFSDHGDEFFEHGNCDHIKSLYDPLVRVPLILRGPGLPAGVRRAEPVELRELGQVALDFAGVDETLGSARRPLLAALRSGAAFADGGAFAAALSETRYQGYAIDAGAWRYTPWETLDRGLVAARTASTKLITDGEGQPLELYDLAADPTEQQDLLGHASAQRTPAHEQAYDALLRWLTARRKAGPAPAIEPHGEVDAATLDELRALGYVGSDSDN